MRAIASPSVASVPEYLVTLPNASIPAMVNRENRTRHSARPYTRNIARGGKPIANPATTAASRMPVPVAENTFSRNTAASGGALGGATGGTRCTC